MKYLIGFGKVITYHPWLLIINCSLRLPPFFQPLPKTALCLHIIEQTEPPEVGTMRQSASDLALFSSSFMHFLASRSSLNNAEQLCQRLIKIEKISRNYYLFLLFLEEFRIYQPQEDRMIPPSALHLSHLNPLLNILPNLPAHMKQV